MHRKILALVVVGALAAGGVSLAAHHALAVTYRPHEQITIEGRLVTLVYRNPHSYLHVEAPDAYRHLRVWAAESGLGFHLREALAAGTLKPGDQVVISGEPARDEGTWRIRMRTLVRRSDGWRWSEEAR